MDFLTKNFEVIRQARRKLYFPLWQVFTNQPAECHSKDTLLEIFIFFPSPNLIQYSFCFSFFSFLFSFRAVTTTYGVVLEKTKKKKKKLLIPLPCAARAACLLIRGNQIMPFYNESAFKVKEPLLLSVPLGTWFLKN